MGHTLFKKLPGSRRSQFEALDKPALKPLPTDVYEYADWKKARVNIDYPIEIDGHYYSVPHAHVKDSVDVRLTATTVECFAAGQRIASHARSHRKGAHTSVVEHMPKAHQKHQEWTPGRFLGNCSCIALPRASMHSSPGPWTSARARATW